MIEISPVACSTGSGMTWSALRVAVRARPLLDTWQTFYTKLHKWSVIINFMTPILLLSWSHPTLPYPFVLKIYTTQIDCTCVRVDLTRDRDMVYSETVPFMHLPLKIQYNKVQTMFVLLQWMLQHESGTELPMMFVRAYNITRQL